MSSALHNARFSWPNTHPHTVVVTGSFDGWSGVKHKLEKTAHGYEGVIPLEFGKVHEYKYVVDGTWQVREDEDKEWDDAGNMNNVRRAPPAPSHSSPVAASSSNAPSSETAVPKASNLIAAAVPGPTASVASVKDAEGLAISPSPRIDELPAAAAVEHHASGLTPSQAVVRDVEVSESTSSPITSNYATTTSQSTSTSTQAVSSDPISRAFSSTSRNAHSATDPSKTPTQPIARLLDEVSEAAPAANPFEMQPEVKADTRVAHLLDGVVKASPDVVPVQEGGAVATVEAAVESAVESLGSLVHGVEGYLFGDRHPVTEKGPVEGAAEEQVEGIQKLEINNVPSTTSTAPTTSNLNITSVPSSHLSSSYADSHANFTSTTTNNDSLPEGLNLGAPIGLGAPIAGGGAGHVHSTIVSSSSNLSAPPSDSENGTETTDFSLVDDASQTSHPDNFQHVSHPEAAPVVVKPSPSPERSAPAVVSSSPAPPVAVVAVPARAPAPASAPAPLPASRARPPTPPQVSSPPPSTTPSAKDPAAEIESKLRTKEEKPKVRSGPIPGSGEAIPESANNFSQKQPENLSEEEGHSAEQVGPSAGRTLASKSVVPDNGNSSSSSHAREPSSPRAAPRTSGAHNRNSVHSQSHTPLSSSQTSAATTAPPPAATSSHLVTPSGSTTTFTPSSSVESSPASSTNRRDENVSGTASTIGGAKEKKKRGVLGKIGGLFGKGKEK